MSKDEGNKVMANTEANDGVQSNLDETSAVVCRVAFKAPAFWEFDPALWFGQVESQFIMAGLTSETTKFHAVVAALDPKVLNCIRDLVVKPPTVDAYETLKKRVLSFFEQSESSKLKLLLSDLHLGDRRPSQLFCEMEALNNGKLQPDALIALWLQRLPSGVQQILSVCSDEVEDSSKLARIADKVYEGSKCTTTHLAAVDTGITGIEGLRNDIAELQKAVTGMQVKPAGAKPWRNRSKSRSRGRSRSPSASGRDGFCWYHAKFRERAHRCKSPCKWSEN